MQFISAAPAPEPDESRVLSQEELAQGWRLGCRHKALAGTEVFLPVDPVHAAQSAVQSVAELQLAVDLGTTSVHWEALDSSHVVVAAGATLNPQLGAGSEVMSRLAFAASPDGAEDLRQVIVQLLREIIASLPGQVKRLSVAGNPAMTLLLLGAPVDGISKAPYRLDEPGGRVVSLAEDLPEAYILPQLAPFVGGDLSAGMTALLMAERPPSTPFLLSDMGTNGEFLLALSESEYISTSVPLGPALEGSGLSCGNVAGTGTVSAFRLTPYGLEANCIGGGASSLDAGITGAGYISLLAILKEQGVLDERGGFASGATPLATKLARDFVDILGERRLNLPGGLFLTASDVEEVLKVKAAFDLAVGALLEAAGLSSGALTCLCLAGALGAHVVPADLESLGFLPPGLGARVRTVGNTSLAGARLVLTDADARHSAEALPAQTRNIDLTGDPAFGQEFVRRMHFCFGNRVAS
ncbi:ASKHA domain-containing protein [Desulfovibrio ferrophilus]|uniref:Ferredoxin n=1 Tax=Desulfovibrio ferrophilus TaxID=241368 RepID=A0A2Z6AVD7_9BACT|nr:ASKHA domain-containing protein [Desulfovibrio ferrophilus]BBD07146.1 ferredoxin [Desulfovibrio ferrophilus]